MRLQSQSLSFFIEPKGNTPNCDQKFTKILLGVKGKSMLAEKSWGIQEKKIELVDYMEKMSIYRHKNNF